jgi:hypothetical protein
MDMPLRLDNAKGVAHMPQQQQTKKDLKPQFKVDPAASARNQRARTPPAPGEIIAESWARSNRYTRARSSESAAGGQT